MKPYCPVMNIKDGADFLSERIRLWEKPFIVVIDGIQGIGKTYFAREVNGRLWGTKTGYLCRPHDLDSDYRQQFYQRKNPDYFLIENIDADPIIVDMIVKKHFRKKPDMEIKIVHDLSEILDPPAMTFKKMMAQWNIVIENPDLPSFQG